MATNDTANGATASALPIIDISPYVSSSASQESKLAVARQLYDACHDVGFFYLVGHGIEQELCDEVINTTREWFLTASQEEKNAISRTDAGGEKGGDGARGYARIGENVTKGKSDFHEGIDFYRDWPDAPSKPPYPPLQGPNLWPAKPPSFRPLFEGYLQQVLHLGSIVMRCMALALELPEEYFQSYIDKSFWVARTIGYPPLTAEARKEGGISCGEHTDYGCTTFLLTDGTKGALKVLAKDGNWINADPIRGAYIINIGDMMELWTNGLWKSTLHKVIHTGENYRVSVPVFFEPNYDARIAPLETCVRKAGGEVKFKGKVYGEHLMEKVTTNFYVSPAEAS